MLTSCMLVQEEVIRCYMEHCSLRISGVHVLLIASANMWHL
jgi:hypothetical protein